MSHERELLRESAETFRRYEALHRDKGTEDSTRKAEVNADIAGRIEAALAATEGEPTHESRPATEDDMKVYQAIADNYWRPAAPPGGGPVAHVYDLDIHARERVMRECGPVNNAPLYLAPPAAPSAPEVTDDMVEAAENYLRSILNGASLPRRYMRGILHAALSEKSAAPEPEAVATVTSETGADISMSWWHEPALPVGTKLYLHPPAAPQSEPVRPAYPGGDVIGPCVCGSWPGGPCLRCEWRPAAPSGLAGRIEAALGAAQGEAVGWMDSITLSVYAVQKAIDALDNDCDWNVRRSASESLRAALGAPSGLAEPLK